MITVSVRARLAFAEGRLDAKYHCSPGVIASENLLLLKAGGIQTRTLAGAGGIGTLGATSRTKRVYAAPGEESLPYLRPYDVFDYLPPAADLLSKAGSAGAERLMPSRGTILQTCSGRNLGPLAYADSYISRFVVSDDMLRLHIDDEFERLYALAFLSTPTGQALLTRSKTGNVIDHLSADDLAAIEVPFFESDVQKSVVEYMKQAIETRETARLTLSELVEATQASLPSLVREDRLKQGWTVRATDLGTRMDAAYWDPAITQLRDALKAAGAVPLGEYAEASLPNWYKRHYVDEGHGRPILSGRQVLQAKPVNLQYIAARSMDFSDYELGVGTTVFGARGRAEDRISQPALITQDRADWLGSENVMRVRPKPGVNAGWLFLSMAVPQVQAQVRAGTYGAVVDVVDIRRLADVLVPAPDEASGDLALTCWDDFATATRLEEEAIRILEDEIAKLSGSRSIS